jgi:hypothetical protein
MKKVKIYYSLLLLFFSFYAKSQTVDYTVSYKNGGLLYQGQVFRKPNEVLYIIQNRTTPEMMRAFEKYKSNRNVSSVLTIIGSGLAGYSLMSNLLNKDVNERKGILVGGLGVAIAGFIVGTQSNQALKEIVRLFNGTENPKVTVVPLIRIDNTSNEIGIAIRF